MTYAEFNYTFSAVLYLLIYACQWRRNEAFHRSISINNEHATFFSSVLRNM